MKSRDLYNFIVTELSNIYPDSEGENIASIILEELYAISRTGLLTNEEVGDPKEVHSILEKLKLNEPIQYVIGKAHFYGRDFIVDPSVLIPRRETEELVHLIINGHRKTKLRVLDIGTGSGCIPITLKLEEPSFEVDAIDISKAALEVATQNALNLGASIKWCLHDVLSKEPLHDKFDIIVSNPPYVTKSEKESMQNNVLQHEPHLALFVEDNNPLLFYQAIVKKAAHSLNVYGMLYFEINEHFGREVAELMTSKGFSQVKIMKDMQGKYRIVKGRLSYK